MQINCSRCKGSFTSQANVPHSLVNTLKVLLITQLYDSKKCGVACSWVLFASEISAHSVNAGGTLANSLAK